MTYNRLRKTIACEKTDIKIRFRHNFSKIPEASFDKTLMKSLTLIIKP